MTIENCGLGFVRNLGITQARGDYILFLDADDTIEPVCLELAYERIKEDRSDFVFFDWKYYYEESQSIRYLSNDLCNRSQLLQGKECLELLSLETYFTVNKLYSRRFLVSHDIQFGVGYLYEDIPFWVKSVISAERISIIQSPLYTIRVNKYSITKTKYQTDVHAKGFIAAVSDAVRIAQREKLSETSDLLTSLSMKFALYYQLRVPGRLKGSFARDYLEAIAPLTQKSLLQDNAFMRRCAKIRLLNPQRAILFILVCRARRLSVAAKRAIRRVLQLDFSGYKGGFFGGMVWLMRCRLEAKKAQSFAREKTVVFLGFDFQYSGNSKYLFDDLRLKGFTNLYFVTDDERVPKQFRLQPQSKELLRAVFRARIIIAESWVPSFITKHPDCVWIQLWHGTPIKRLLFDSPETEITQNYPRHKQSRYANILKWDYFLLDSRGASRYFETGFLMPQSKMLPWGYPRVHYLNANMYNHELRNALRKMLGACGEQKIILYLPTWRDYNYKVSAEQCNLQYLLNVEELQKCLGDAYFVVSKGHDFQDDILERSTSSMDLQDLLLGADIIVSDYSSVVFDALTIDKPVYLYVNDFEQYEESRGVYPDMWGLFKQRVFEKEGDLAKAIIRSEVQALGLDDHTGEYCNSRESNQMLINLLRDKLEQRG